MDKKIYIDFMAGSHGNYLHFVCNRFLANIPTQKETPFNRFGAAHDKFFLCDPVFECDHYTSYHHTLVNEKVIIIWIDSADLLPLQCISLLRAGDYNIRPDELEHDTYHKLNNKEYRWVLDNLLHSFFNFQHVIDGYNAIADPSWPPIKNASDYEMLPSHIRQECENLHHIEIKRLDDEHPNCARHILREFFRIGFTHPENHGLMQQQAHQIHKNCDIYRFPFAAFYDVEKFVSELVELGNFCHLPLKNHKDRVLDLHREFLVRQPYRSVKSKCDDLVNQLLIDPNTILPELDVIQEAYIECKLLEKNDPR